MTTYLAGPMSHLPDHNYPAFHAAAAVPPDDERSAGRRTFGHHDVHLQRFSVMLGECDGSFLDFVDTDRPPRAACATEKYKCDSREGHSAAGIEVRHSKRLLNVFRDLASILDSGTDVNESIAAASGD